MMEPTSDTTMSPPPVPAAPAAKPRSKLSRVAWGIFGLIAIVIGGSQIYNGVQSFFVLPACDSQTAKDTLSNIFKEHKFEPLRYESVKTVSSDKDKVVCNAVLPLPDGANLIADYNMYWEGRSVQVKYELHRKAP